MNQYEVPALIADNFPEIEQELHFLSGIGDVNKSLKILSNYTIEMMRRHYFSKVKACMQVADRIYSHGNHLVRISVESVFIYSFGLMKAYCNDNEWKVLRSIMTDKPYQQYIQQVCNSAS